METIVNATSNVNSNLLAAILDVPVDGMKIQR